MGKRLEADDFVKSNIYTGSNADYFRLLDELSAVFQAVEGTPESDRCDVLCDLIEAYEAINYPMETSSLDTTDNFSRGVDAELPPLRMAGKK